MIIREMELNDLSEVFEIEKSIFSSYWSISDYRYELIENPYSKYYILEENNRVIGYVGYWITFDIAQITTIGILKEYQGKGYSNNLMKKVIEDVNKSKCENISLEVRVSNKTAISLYEKYGFQIVNIRKSYYSDNHEDAYLMVKPLGENL
ncbi:MAG: ribosomal protein S18-alanine N-acetyltransferase [Erysipelotrichaceae bacterium]|nr:ribosomal protein S18-alanine N-acetyltransferase [Erysipelotrichaceae bacterium]